MRTEIEILSDIKNTFGWPVDLFRYGLMKNKRYLRGNRETSSLTDALQIRIKESLAKMRFAKQHLLKLSKLPWVRMIFITGSTASLNAKAEDDIDVWLIVDDKRIWISRMIDYLLYLPGGHRRLARDGAVAHKVKNKFCFNFYSTYQAMELPLHSISYAIQFTDAVPLYIRDINDYKNLLQANSWVMQYFPHWYEMAISWTNGVPATGRRLKNWYTPLLDLLEYCAGVFMILKAEKSLEILPQHVFRKWFTTWGTPRILSRYDKETLTKSGKESE